MPTTYYKNAFSHMYLRLPLYVGFWLRTKYMSDRLAPIRIPVSHPAGRIVYTSLVCNDEMKKLSPLCYSAQMYGIPSADIPDDLRYLYPEEDTRKEFVSVALPTPHFYLGKWIDDTDMWQLSSSAASDVKNILVDEMWSDVDNYWSDYQHNWSISHTHVSPEFFQCLLDFCELYAIDIDAFDAMLRAYKRRKKRIRESDKRDETAQ